MKVIDFIEKFTGTIDVYDNYTEELSIAYCGEKLTEAGKKHFAEALQLPIDHFDTENALISRTQKATSVLYKPMKGLAELFIPAARKVAEQDIFEV